MIKEKLIERKSIREQEAKLLTEIIELQEQYESIRHLTDHLLYKRPVKYLGLMTEEKT